MVSKDFNKITLVCITMRFKCSSVAMRRKRCMSSATQILQVRALVYSLYKVTQKVLLRMCVPLWCVTKGRASAPPMSALITGVSISMYPR